MRLKAARLNEKSEQENLGELIVLSIRRYGGRI
jgi:hypothetical protein